METKHYISLIILLLLSSTYVLFDTNQGQVSLSSEFQTWKQQFNKIYESQSQEFYRLSIFVENINKIQIHNSKKGITYTIGLNQFSDLTEEEFTAKHLTLMPPTNSLRMSPETPTSSSNIKDDTSINWVEKGYVTSIKDQGQCGACWAFAAIGPLQAMIKQQGGPLISLSAQQLMDCSYSYGNQGCNGGLMDNGYKYIKDKGITTQQKYPYKGAYQACKIDGGQYKVKGFVDLQNCKDLAAQLLKIPIAVAVDATQFYQYKGGVFNGCSSKPQLNHAFALVGMTPDYWLGKQQWGVKWGQNGFIRIAKNGTACGLCQMASYPI